MKKLPLIVVVGLLSACATEANVQPISAANLEEQVEARVEDEFAVPVDVSCPKSLKSEVGATAQCVLTPEGSTSAVVAHLTVTAVAADGQVEFDIELDVPAESGSDSTTAPEETTQPSEDS